MKRRSTSPFVRNATPGGGEHRRLSSAPGFLGDTSSALLANGQTSLTRDSPALLPSSLRALLSSSKHDHTTRKSLRTLLSWGVPGGHFFS